MVHADAPVLTAARFGVVVATGLLPSRPARERYRAEFLAELYGLPASAQLRYTVGVLSQTLALRAALGSIPEMAPSVSIGRWIRCHILRWHDWRTYRTDDGERYSACSICGRFPVDALSRNSFGG